MKNSGDDMSLSLTGSVENDEVCHMNPQVLFRLFEDSAVSDIARSVPSADCV